MPDTPPSGTELSEQSMQVIALLLPAIREMRQDTETDLGDLLKSSDDTKAALKQLMDAVDELALGGGASGSAAVPNTGGTQTDIAEIRDLIASINSALSGSTGGSGGDTSSGSTGGSGGGTSSGSNGNSGGGADPHGKKAFTPGQFALFDTPDTSDIALEDVKSLLKGVTFELPLDGIDVQTRAQQAAQGCAYYVSEATRTIVANGAAGLQLLMNLSISGPPTGTQNDAVVAEDGVTTISELPGLVETAETKLTALIQNITLLPGLDKNSQAAGVVTTLSALTGDADGGVASFVTSANAVTETVLPTLPASFTGVSSAIQTFITDVVLPITTAVQDVDSDDVSGLAAGDVAGASTAIDTYATNLEAAVEGASNAYAALKLAVTAYKEYEPVATLDAVVDSVVAASDTATASAVTATTHAGDVVKELNDGNNDVALTVDAALTAIGLVVTATTGSSATLSADATALVNAVDTLDADEFFGRTKVLVGDAKTQAATVATEVTALDTAAETLADDTAFTGTTAGTAFSGLADEVLSTTIANAAAYKDAVADVQKEVRKLHRILGELDDCYNLHRSVSAEIEAAVPADISAIETAVGALPASITAAKDAVALVDNVDTSLGPSAQTSINTVISEVGTLKGAIAALDFQPLFDLTEGNTSALVKTLHPLVKDAKSVSTQLSTIADALDELVDADSPLEEKKGDLNTNDVSAKTPAEIELDNITTELNKLSPLLERMSMYVGVLNAMTDSHGAVDAAMMTLLLPLTSLRGRSVDMAGIVVPKPSGGASVELSTLADFEAAAAVQTNTVFQVSANVASPPSTDAGTA